MKTLFDTETASSAQKLCPQDADHIVVWVSFGAASAVAAWETLRRYGDRCHVSLVNNPVIEEDPDNLRFGLDLEEWLGRPIIRHVNPEYSNASAREVWARRQARLTGIWSEELGQKCFVNEPSNRGL